SASAGISRPYSAPFRRRYWPLRLSIPPRKAPSISIAFGVIGPNGDLSSEFLMPSHAPRDRLQLRRAYCTASPGLLILRQEKYRRRRSLNTRSSLRGSKAIWIAIRQAPYTQSSTTFQTRTIGDNG